MELPPGRERDAAVHAVAEQMAARDPRAAVAWLQSDTSGPARTGALTRAVQIWSEREPEAALAFAREQGGALRQQLIAVVAQNWARQDGAAAFRALGSTVDDAQQQGVLQSVMYQWSQQDPMAALAAVRAMSGPGRPGVLQFIVGQLATRDPEAALDAVASLPSASDRTAALQGAIRAMAVDDPETAAVMLEALPAGEPQVSSTIEVISALSRQDPERARVWLMGLPASRPKLHAVQQLAGELVRTDPQGAVALAMSLPPGMLRDQALGSVAQGWAQEDVGAALAWVQQLPAGEGRLSALRNVMTNWAQRDPAAVVAYAAKLPPEDLEQLAPSLGAGAAQRSPTDIVAWSERLPAGVARDRFLSNVISNRAHHSPQEAAQLLVHMNPDSRRQAAQIVAYQWAQADPAQALSWAKGLGDEPSRTQAQAGAIASWAQVNRAAADQALRQLPAGASRDKVIQEATSHLGWQAPEIAAGWINLMADQSNRVQATERLAQQWLQRDRRSAEGWLLSSGLDPARVQALLNGERPNG